MTFYSEAEARVIETLSRRPGITVAGLVAATHSRSTVRNALIKAQAQGRLIITQEWPRRYTLTATPVVAERAESNVVIPDEVDTKQIGETFKKGRPAIVKALNGINLETQDRTEVLQRLELVGKAVLGLYVALGRVEDGPEWRQEAGVL